MEHHDADAVEIDVQLELKDFVYMNYSVVLRSLTAKLFVAFAAALLVWSLALAVFAPEQLTWGGFVLPAFVLLTAIGVHFAAKRHFYSNRALQQRIRYRFTPESLEATAPDSSGRTAWANIREFYETNHSFLLFLSNVQVYTIPKRCFSGPAQIEMFRGLIQRSIDPGFQNEKRRKAFRGAAGMILFWSLVVITAVLIYKFLYVEP
jgi:hypothetical protein